MKATVRKWGNSAAVRIPGSVLRTARIDLDEVVDVREEAGRIVIEVLAQNGQFGVTATPRSWFRFGCHRQAGRKTAAVDCLRPLLTLPQSGLEFHRDRSGRRSI